MKATGMRAIGRMGVAATAMGLILALTAGTAAAAPEMSVRGINDVAIANGETVVSAATGTDFGTATIFAPVDHTFTIINSGPDALDLTGTPKVTLTGTDFSVVTQPSSPVAAGGSTTFTVRFLPKATGTRTTTISIINSDALKTPYTFALQGTGATAAIPVEGNNWTMTMTYNHNIKGQASTVNYTVNGTLYSANAVHTLATITGGENTWSFDVNSHTAFGRYAYWGAARTDMIEWVFDAMGGSGVFQTFTFNPWKANRNTLGGAEWWVKVNNGAFVKVWEAAEAGTFSVGTIDLGVNGANLLQGGASKVTVRGISNRSHKDGASRVVYVDSASKTQSALTISASIAQPQGTIISIR